MERRNARFSPDWLLVGRQKAKTIWILKGRYCVPYFFADKLIWRCNLLTTIEEPMMTQSSMKWLNVQNF